MPLTRHATTVAVVAVATATIGATAGGITTAASGSATAPTRTTAARHHGATPVFAPADKQGFGTAHSTSSRVWFTLRDGTLSDVYYPDLSTPSVRSLQLVVTDGKTFTDLESSATTHAITLLDAMSLTYREVDTAKSGDYRITTTYVSDTHRASVLLHVKLESLTGKPYRVYVDYRPALDNIGDADTATTRHSMLLASAGHAASALIARPALRGSTNGYVGQDAGRAQLERHHRLVRHDAVASNGNVAQTARTALTGLAGHRSMTLALGFGHGTTAATQKAHRSLHRGFATARTSYEASWHRYLASIHPAPHTVAAAREHTLYDVSAMVLAAGEDKTHRGAFVASPSMPWEWGTPAGTKPKRSGPYHLVWARDEYQIATALIADGDTAAAKRAEHYLFFVQQKANGRFPQNSTVTGTPYWTGHQLDEWSLPTVLAWQLHDHSAATFTHVRRAEDAVIADGPHTQQERWENQSGYSPATIAAEIAGLVTGADLATATHHTKVAAHYLAVADKWQADVKKWTATTNGPLSAKPYFLRVAKGGHPNRATHYAIGDSGPASIDQRKIVDPSFLELVRLGVLSPTDPDVVNSLAVVDRTLRVMTPSGPMWHRYTDDGYGETATGKPWVIQGTGTPKTFGRLWPLLTGERGEYAIATGHAAAPYLATMASAAGPGYLLPEQVWDGRPPTGSAGHKLGTPTDSASPLLWTHAQFIRLAWDAAYGTIREQPSIVAQRYAH
jgi:glucoamylase